MKVRSIKLEWGGTILNTPPFEGSLYTTRQTFGRGENSTSFCYLSSYLSLNPTRMLNWTAQSLAFNKDNLFNHRPANQHLRGIDGMDNVLPLNQIERAKGEATKDYIKAVYDLLDFELSRASQAIDGFHLTGDLRTNDFSMRRIETYWEFYSPDAIGLLDQITPTLRMFHKNNHERKHGKQDQAIDLVREKNGKSVKMFLSKGVEIIVYTKTDTRIRFEVVLKPNRQSGLIEGGYKVPTINAVHSKLLQCKEKSASKLNHLLAFLREHREESPKQRANSIHYLSRWFQLLGHSESSIHLLNKLKSTGVIIGGKSLSEDQSKMLRKAKDNGLISKNATAGGHYPCDVHACS